jgi:hypothetical protein
MGTSGSGGSAGTTSGTAGSSIGGGSGLGGGAGTAGGGGGEAGVDAGADTCTRADVDASSDIVTIPPCGNTPGTTIGAYSGLVTMKVSGLFVITPGNPLFDPFYQVDPNNTSVSTGACTGCLRYNRSSEGTCLCGFECPSTSHGVSDLLVGPYPSFSPTHEYTVQLDLGNAPPERLDFAPSDCGCSDNSGTYMLTITPAIAPCSGGATGSGGSAGAGGAGQGGSAGRSAGSGGAPPDASVDASPADDGGDSGLPDGAVCQPGSTGGCVIDHISGSSKISYCDANGQWTFQECAAVAGDTVPCCYKGVCMHGAIGSCPSVYGCGAVGVIEYCPDGFCEDGNVEQGKVFVEINTCGSGPHGCMCAPGDGCFCNQCFSQQDSLCNGSNLLACNVSSMILVSQTCADGCIEDQPHRDAICCDPALGSCLCGADGEQHCYNGSLATCSAGRLVNPQPCPNGCTTPDGGPPVCN